ncbi:copper chaperone CopZ [Pueribacillus sp. YX66]|uniref:copper chaperone CopZ n=1 Tax=Pueribacillus sp. YX66 TaxID=3229242 RepID=UPI00358CF6E9
MTETIKLQIKGMSCSHCKSAVENAIKEIDGVQSANVQLDEGTVTVMYDSNKVDIDHFTEAIDEAGYELIGQV